DCGNPRGTIADCWGGSVKFCARTGFALLHVSGIDPKPTLVTIWLGQLGRSLDVFSARIAAPAMSDYFVDELHGIGREKSLRVPRSDRPSSDRHTAVHHHGHANSGARNSHWRRNHSNTVASLAQCDQRLGSDAFVLRHLTGALPGAAIVATVGRIPLRTQSEITRASISRLL